MARAGRGRYAAGLMFFPRSSGILLHPTSLAGAFGIGDLGPEALAFVDQLAASGQSWWQVLPLGPTSYGDSPYQNLSSHALNPLLLSPELMAREGLLDPADWVDRPNFDPSQADFGLVTPWKRRLLRRGVDRFLRGEGDSPRERNQRFDAFRVAHADWLADFALFGALKEREGGRPWTEWPTSLALREVSAVERARNELALEIRAIEVEQFLAFTQWDALRSHARARGVRILGDVPIFVAHDSSDVWAWRDSFDLDERGLPRTVAGVPPDYFSETGQLWGNPLYRWEVMARAGDVWWVARLRTALRQADAVRIDHFRGFEAYWEIPAGDSTARNGRWVKGPGRRLFDAVAAGLGKSIHELPIVAEDLGEITPEVHELRDSLGFPGMRILQFGFGESPRTEWHAPHNYNRNCVVYTGTHDNDTTCGWFAGSPGASVRSEEAISSERGRVLRYLGTDGREIHWNMIRVLLQSVADTAIIPLQDVLGLGGEARMNTPGRAEGNWRWRCAERLERSAEIQSAFRRLEEITRATGRSPEPTSGTDSSLAATPHPAANELPTSS